MHVQRCGSAGVGTMSWQHIESEEASNHRTMEGKQLPSIGISGLCMFHTIEVLKVQVVQKDANVVSFFH